MTKSQIFRSAWIIARRDAATLAAPIRSVFGVALRRAWAAAKNAAASSTSAAPAVAALTPAQKVQRLADTAILWPARLRNTFAFRFICENADRVANYGEKTKFSDKQIAIIDEMYARNY